MPFTVEPLKNDDEWRLYEKNSCFASFFHSLEWRDFIKQACNLEPNYLVARNDFGQIAGIYPGFISKARTFNFHESVPFADYGGPLCDNEQVGFAFQDYFSRHSSEIGIDYLKLCLTSGIGYFPSIFKSNLSVVQRHKGVMEINLNSSDPEFLLNELISSSSLRRKIRKIDDSPYKAVQGSSIKDLEKFYRVYCANIKFLGAKPWNYSMIKLMWQKFYPNNLRLWLMGENEVAGASLVLKNYHGSLVKFLCVNRELKLAFPIAKYLFWKETLQATIEGSKKISFGSTPSDPSDVHYLNKLSVGSTFREQEIIWFPVSSKGCILLQTRRKTEASWLKIRDSLPKTIKMSVQNMLIKI